MAKSLKKASTTPQHTYQQPQDGLWWRYLVPKEVTAVQNKSPNYGSIITSENLPQHLANVPTVRFHFSEAYVRQWEVADPGGQLLVIDPTALQPSEYYHNPASGNVVVLGTAAIRVGQLKPLTPPVLGHRPPQTQTPPKPSSPP